MEMVYPCNGSIYVCFGALDNVEDWRSTYMFTMSVLVVMVAAVKYAR